MAYKPERGDIRVTRNRGKHIVAIWAEAALPGEWAPASLWPASANLEDYLSSNRMRKVAELEEGVGDSLCGYYRERSFVR